MAALWSRLSRRGDAADNVENHAVENHAVEHHAVGQPESAGAVGATTLQRGQVVEAVAVGRLVGSSLSP